MTTREVLEEVAAGRMSPEEATARLAGGGGAALRRVRVKAATRTVRVIGDPGVSEVAVSGLHQVRREGDTLVVLAHPGEGGGGFSFVPPDVGRLVAEGKARARQAATQAAREAARVAYAAGRPGWAPRSSARGRQQRKDFVRDWKRDAKGEWDQEWAPRRDHSGRPGWGSWSDWMGGPGGPGGP
ncbi:MAG: hypothetical protein ACRDWV_02670, partial [Acidimicrobiales bacterium]